MACIGCALIIAAAAANQAWFDRHFLPSFWTPREEIVRTELLVRIGVAVIGAAVSLFAPSILDRNLDDDRPHLGPGLVWLPPARHWRLTSLARRLVGYRSEDAIERGVSVTREVLAATVRLAQSRGAVPLIVVPQFEPEEPQERELRRRIVEEAHLPYVYVPIDSDDRVENDGHPDADGARTIAESIADALRPALAARANAQLEASAPSYEATGLIRPSHRLDRQ